MKKAIFGFIYFKVLGWKAIVNVPDYDKYIICAAPHTSNWDLFIGKLCYGAIGRDAGFLMKKDWFFWPLGSIFRCMGGNLRQEDVAKVLHCSQACYSNYENGKRDIPTEVLDKLANYYNVSVDYLLSRTYRKEPYPR